MKRLCTVGLLYTCGMISLAAHAADTDFEGLSQTSLAGQDGWESIVGSLNVAAGTGANTTQVVTTSVASGVNEFSRLSNQAFGFSTGVAGSIQFDLQWQVPSIPQRNGGAWFAVGHDTSDSGTTLGGSERGPWVGMQHGTGGTGIYLREAGSGAEHIVPVVAGIDDGDWISIRLDMDFAANSGDGAGSVLIKNLTDGDTAFSAIAGLQNVNLQIQSIAVEARDPASWDAAFIRVDREFENPMALDNLMINVPEPSSLALLGLGGVLLTRRRRVS